MIGRGGTEHILATNIDTAFMVTAADSSFDHACLEQMLVMTQESGARPVQKFPHTGKGGLPELVPASSATPRSRKRWRCEVDGQRSGLLNEEVRQARGKGGTA